MGSPRCRPREGFRNADEVGRAPGELPQGGGVQFMHDAGRHAPVWMESTSTTVS